MFYMPGTKMLFGDAKDTCEGARMLYALALRCWRQSDPMMIVSHQEGARSEILGVGIRHRDTADDKGAGRKESTGGTHAERCGGRMVVDIRG